MQVDVNGVHVASDDAHINIDDRGMKYADAAFEVTRAYGGELFRWEEHAARLRRTCDVLHLDHGLGETELRQRQQRLLDLNGLMDAKVRLTITRGRQPGSHTPSPDVDPTVTISCQELPRGGRGGTPAWDGPATARIVETRHIPERSIPSHAKTHNYLHVILARLELSGTNADEAILLDSEGFLTEETTSNLFFVDDGTLYTPGEEVPLLPGITRAFVLELAEDLGVPTETGEYTPEALYSADEAFLTSTSREIRPIGRVDSHEIGSGPITDRLTRAFDDRIERQFY